MNNENYFSHNEPCLRCRSKGNDKHGDNLAIYSDGHTHCWSCGFFSPSSIANRRNIRVRSKPSSIELPEDCNTEYSNTALKWVAQYGFTKKDLLLNHVLWSDEGRYINLKGNKTQCTQQLIFPFWNGGDLLGYIGRYFGGVDGIPKWLTRGKMQEIYHILPATIQPIKKTIVLTEDLLSAMKVNQVGHEAMPVLGIHAKGRFKHLKLLGYHKVILWLDPDMHMEMTKQSTVGTLEGLEMHTVLSDVDPKEHSYNEIKEYLK